MRKHHLHLQGHEFVSLMMQGLCEGAGNVLQLLPPPKPSPPSLREPLHICIIIVSANNQQHPAHVGEYAARRSLEECLGPSAACVPQPNVTAAVRRRGAHTKAAGAKRAN